MHNNPILPSLSSITDTSADQSSDIAASDFSVLRQKTAKVCRGIWGFMLIWEHE